MRYFVDVMTGVPSIVFGLFIYIVLVTSHIGGDFTGWKGSVALSLLMLPIVVRAAEVVLLLVPGGPARGGAGPRRAALAGRHPGGAADGAARPDHRLAAGRRPRDGRDRAAAVHRRRPPTASPPTSAAQMNTLPTQIFNDISSPRDVVISRAWGAALTLVALVLILNLIARAVARRSRVA